MPLSPKAAGRPALALSLLALLAIAVWQSDRWLEPLLRPAAARVAGAALDAEVAIDHLLLDWGRLSLSGLRVDKTGSFRLDLPRAEATWTFASLLRGRLVGVLLERPKLVLEAREKEAEKKGLPRGRPLLFDDLHIDDARLDLEAAGRRVEVRDLDLELQDGAPPAFTLTAQVGADRSVPLALAGTVLWLDELEFTLERLAWDSRELLAAPLALTIAPDGSVHGRAELRLADLAETDLRPTLSALGLSNPVPSAFAFTLRGIAVDAEVEAPRLRVEVRVAEGQLRHPEARFPFTDLRLALAGTGEEWHGTAEARLAGRFPVRLDGGVTADGTASAVLEVTGFGAPAGAGALIEADLARRTTGELSAIIKADRLSAGDLRSALPAFGLAVPLPADLDFTLRQPELTLNGRPEKLTAAFAVPEGTVPGEGWSLPLAELALEAAGSGRNWSGEGSLRLAGAPVSVHGEIEKNAATGRFELHVADVASFAHRINGRPPLPVAGGARLRAELKSQGDDLSARWNLRGEAGKAEPETLLDLASLSAEGTAKRSGGTLAFKGEAKAEEKTLFTAEGTAARVAARLGPVSWGEIVPLLGPKLKGLPVRSGEELTAAAVWARRGESWEAELRGDAAAVGLARGRAEGVTAAGEIVPVETGFALKGWTVNGKGSWEEVQVGRFEARGSGEVGGGGFGLRLDRLAASGLDYLPADGLSGMSGGHLEGSGEVAGDFDGPLTIDLTADFGAGEVLYGAFYADLTGLPARLMLRGRIDPAGPSLTAEALTLSLADTAEFVGSATVAPPTADFSGAVTISELSAAAGRLLPPLTGSLPKLSGAEAVGRVTVDLDLHHAPSGWRAAGELRPETAGLRLPALDLEVREMSGRLPFFLGPEAKGAERPGELTLGELRAGPLRLAEARIPLTAGADGYVFPEPLVFGLADGRLNIAELALSDLSGTPGFAARVALDEVDLARLTADLGLPPLAGRVSADLGAIRFADDELSTEGAAEIEAFSGRILVRNIRARSPFSSYRTLLGDIDFTGIDLFQFTRTFEFGEMNGIADGYVHELRLFGAVPSHFQAKFETRPTGKRNISVKALKNISLLSQGGISAALSRGIYRFIDFYRYRRIGFVCSLENDVFRLEGTARPDSDRYLVYGGWLPPKIDVIAPPGTISFKEMVKRLSRLDRTAGEKNGE